MLVHNYNHTVFAIIPFDHKIESICYPPDLFGLLEIIAIKPDLGILWMGV